MDIKSTLEQFGLTGRKADIYLASLELGGASVIEIAKKAGIKRTTCYDILVDLKSQGLISETAKGKKRLFIGEDPEKIKKDLLKKESLFNEILPQLKSIYNVKGTKPKIKFYEGKEGLKEVYDDTLRYSGQIMAFACADDVVNLLGLPWADGYLKQRVKKNIPYRGILTRTKMMENIFLPKNQAQLRTVKLIEPKKYPFSVEINLYGHQRVALISAKEQTAVIIESAEIYNTIKLIFGLCWDHLPEVKLK